MSEFFSQLFNQSAAAQRMREENIMRGDAFRHDIQRLFDELSVEHLMTLRRLLTLIAQQTDATLASYLEGVASTTLHLKHDVCGGCGKNHLNDLLENETKSNEAAANTDNSNEQLNALNNFKENLFVYQVVLPDGSHTLNDPVICIYCGEVFESLEKRMETFPGPAGCPGCLNKTEE